MESSKPSDPARRPIKSRGAKWANVSARWLTGLGVRPNAVSIASVFFGAGAGGAFWASGRAGGISPGWWFLAAAIFIQLRLLCNLLDGMIAIEGGLKSKTGEIYNELPDRFADLLIIGGAGYGAGAVDWQPELAWIAAGLAVTTAYVRALGVAAGASQKFGGPMAKPHRMALLTAAAVIQAGATLFIDTAAPVMYWALILMAAGCVVTIVRRGRSIVAELEAK